MRVFVYEFISGGGMAGSPLPGSLAREGELMLTALLDDLTKIEGVEAFTTRDARLGPLDMPIEVMSCDETNAEAVFDRALQRADAVWPIAPETGDLLETLSWRILHSGRKLLGSHPGAVAVAGSKWRTCQALLNAGVNSVASHRAFSVPNLSGAWVAKPDDGVGCDQTHYFAESAALRDWLEATNAQGYVIQPFVAGAPMSLSTICCDGKACLLSCNTQQVELVDNRFVFHGCTVNASWANWNACAELADRVAAAIPGLWGYVGMDFVQTPAGPVVIEVNPRVTTSYAGLARALRANPGGWVLDLPRLPAWSVASAQSGEAVRIEIGAEP